MSKAISVSFNVNFKGVGIVNYNFPTKRAGQDHMAAKSIFVQSENTLKPYTSRNCILHEVLKEPFAFKLLSQSNLPEDRVRVNLSKYRMLRGNLDATEGCTLKRKSAFCMTDALPAEECDSIFTEYIAKGNMGGGCTRDKVNNTSLSSYVNIDLDALQFISTNHQINAAAIDPGVFDRGSKSYENVKAIWEENYPETPMPDVKYFNKVDSQGNVCSQYSTMGVKLSDADVASIVLWFMQRFAQFSLEKRDAFLKFHSFTDIIINTTSGKEKYITLSDLQNRLTSEDWSVFSSYAETDTPVSCEHIFQHIEESKNASKAEKAEKVAKAKKAKVETENAK
jgi:hypothetical protein